MTPAMQSAVVIRNLPLIVQAAEHLAHIEGLPPGMIAARLHITLPEAAAHLDLARAARRVLAATISGADVDPIALANEAGARWRDRLAELGSQAATMVSPEAEPRAARVAAPVSASPPAPPVPPTISRPKLQARLAMPIRPPATPAIRFHPSVLKSQAQRERPVEMVAEGLPPAEISKPVRTTKESEPNPNTKRAQIIRLAVEGIRPSEIAQQVGVRLSCVQEEISHLRKRGVEIPRFEVIRPKTAPDPDSKRARIIRLALEGILPTEIAQQVGVGVTHVATEISNARKRGILIPKTARKPYAPWPKSKDANSLNSGSPPTMLAVLEAMNRGTVNNQVIVEAPAIVAAPVAVDVAPPVCVEPVSEPAPGRKPSGQRPQAIPDPGSKRARLIELAVEGIRPSEIAGRLEMSPNAVSTALWQERKHGALIPNFNDRPNSQRKQIVALARQGHPPAEIARRLNTSKDAVYARLSSARKTDPTIPLFAVVAVVVTPSDGANLVAELHAAAQASAMARGVPVSSTLEWRAAAAIERLMSS